MANWLTNGFNTVDNWLTDKWNGLVKSFGNSSAYKAYNDAFLTTEKMNNTMEMVKNFTSNTAKKKELLVPKTDVGSEGTVLGNIADTLTGDNHKENNELLLQSALNQMAYQTQSAERAMQFSAEQAKLNRDWQEYMSSTAYQRAVDDLKKAGLNPVLAYTNLSPASTPSGSSASGFAQSGAKADVDLNNYAPSMLSAFGDVLTGVGDVLDIVSVVSSLMKKTNKIGFGD